MSILSMTGFGRGRCEVAGRRFVVEIRSVNHRFLDLKTRLPWSDPVVEQQVAAAVRARLARGAVTVAVRDDSGGGGGGAEVGIDLTLARAYARAMVELADGCDIQETPSLALLAAQPGVLISGAERAGGDELWSVLAPGIAAALDELVAARAREGAALLDDLRGRVLTLRRLVAELTVLAADVPGELRRRLDERIARLLAGVGTAAEPGGEQAAAGVHLDPQRLAQEVAILADRGDIIEELTRLVTHLDEVDRLLGAPTPSGRRLDFLAQELHREVNTVGSKAQRTDITTRVIEAKVEVERIREQVQNIE